MPVMDVALATGAVARPFTIMTARSSGIADEGPGATTPSADSKSDPLTNRYPMVAFSYDVDASRLVMLYRDPGNGKTVSQIPTETALKQYKEAQEQEKLVDRAASLKMTIGSAAAKASTGADTTGAKTASSPGSSSVANSAPSTTLAAAVAVAGVGGGTAVATSRVNLVI